MISYIKVSVILSLVLSLKPTVAEEIDSRRSVQELKKQLADTNEPRSFGRLINEAFTELTLEQLEALRFDNDLSIALAAAWRLRDAPHWSWNQPEGKVTRYFGYIEGRIGFLPPPYWTSKIAKQFFPKNMESQDKVDSSINWPKAIQDTPKYSKDSLILVNMPGRLLSVSFTEGSPTLSSKDNHLELTSPTATSRIVVDPAIRDIFTSHWPDYCTIYCTDEYIILIAYHNVSLPFPIVCLDAKTGRMRWKNIAWGTGKKSLEIGGGPRGHRCQLHATNDRILLFGNDENRGSYIDSFCIADGVATCRFSTNLWFALDVR